MAAEALQLTRKRLGSDTELAKDLGVDRAILHRIRLRQKAGLSEGSYLRIRHALTGRELTLWEEAFADPYLRLFEQGYLAALPPGSEWGSSERERTFTVWSRLPKLLGLKDWRAFGARLKRIDRAVQELGANSDMAAGLLAGAAMALLLRPLGMGESIGVTRSVEQLAEDGSLRRYLFGAAKAYSRIVGPEPNSTPRGKGSRPVASRARARTGRNASG